MSRARLCADTRSRRPSPRRRPVIVGALNIHRALDYNEIMARGWASKSVAAQIDVAEDPQRSAVIENTLDPERLRSIRLKENILLSRTRVVRDLKNAQNPRYQALMKKALADLDAQLSTLGAD
jgi:hypothetical protein